MFVKYYKATTEVWSYWIGALDALPHPSISSPTFISVPFDELSCLYRSPPCFSSSSGRFQPWSWRKLPAATRSSFYRGSFIPGSFKLLRNVNLRTWHMRVHFKSCKFTVITLDGLRPVECLRAWWLLLYVSPEHSCPLSWKTFFMNGAIYLALKIIPSFVRTPFLRQGKIAPLVK